MSINSVFSTLRSFANTIVRIPEISNRVSNIAQGALVIGISAYLALELYNELNTRASDQETETPLPTSSQSTKSESKDLERRVGAVKRHNSQVLGALKGKMDPFLEEPTTESVTFEREAFDRAQTQNDTEPGDEPLKQHEASDNVEGEKRPTTDKPLKSILKLSGSACNVTRNVEFKRKLLKLAIYEIDTPSDELQRLKRTSEEVRQFKDGIKAKAGLPRKKKIGKLHNPGKLSFKRNQSMSHHRKTD